MKNNFKAVIHILSSLVISMSGAHGANVSMYHIVLVYAVYTRVGKQ